MTATTDPGVLDTLGALESCWRAGDADAYAALHTEDATYVAFDGTVMTGREEIADGHRPLFAGIMRGSRLATVDRTVHFPAPDTAVVVQRAGVIMRWQRRTTPSAKRLSTNTTVLRHDGSRWTVTAFQNTRYHPWAKTLTGRLMTRLAK